MAAYKQDKKIISESIPYYLWTQITIHKYIIMLDVNNGHAVTCHNCCELINNFVDEICFTCLDSVYHSVQLTNHNCPAVNNNVQKIRLF